MKKAIELLLLYSVGFLFQTVLHISQQTGWLAVSLSDMKCAEKSGIFSAAIIQIISSDLTDLVSAISMKRGVI